MQMKTYLEKLIRKEDLSAKECQDALGKMSDAVQAGAFFALLRSKGETAEEICGFVKALRNAQAKELDVPYPVLDIVGTGGDHAGTVNISTGGALLAARSGLPVVKHGNRAISSRSGSADVLEALGFSFENPKESLEKTGFAFCLAGDFHPIMHQMRPMRQSLQIPTILNILGPLLNPARASHLMIGVHKPELVAVIANALFQLGTKRSLVYHGFGLDELTCLGVIDVLLVTDTTIEPFRIDPEELGLKLCTREDLQGGDAQTNAMLLGQALTGSSPLSDTLVLNAAVALFLYGRATTLKEGVSMAKAALRRKSLKEALESPNAILAEIKRSSPSRGKIGSIPDPGKRASLYVEGGASAISVLTSSRFDGSLEDLGAVAKSLVYTPVPVLRKDFILEPIQIAQAAAHGADAVLLIASFLKERTQEMLDLTKKMGLEALVEVHREEELAYFHDAEIVGVNQRNLLDFSMHPEAHDNIIDKLPKDCLSLAASGILSSEDATRVFALGYRAILIGEALTRSLNPLDFLSVIRSSSLCL